MPSLIYSDVMSTVRALLPENEEKDKQAKEMAELRASLAVYDASRLDDIGTYLCIALCHSWNHNIEQVCILDTKQMFTSHIRWIAELLIEWERNS